MQLRIALVLAALSSFGIAVAQNQADIAYLQSGVQEIAPGNYNGSLIVFGEQAFPVVNGRSEQIDAGKTLFGEEAHCACHQATPCTDVFLQRSYVFAGDHSRQYDHDIDPIPSTRGRPSGSTDAGALSFLIRGALANCISHPPPMLQSGYITGYK